MFGPARGVRVYLCTQPTDMRKSFDGLVAATKSVMGQNPLSGGIYVFVNRKGNQAKALYWERGGYCVWAKRLEQGRFAKVAAAGVSLSMTDTQLMMWLDGIEITNTRQKKRFVLPGNAAVSGTIQA